MAGHTPTHPIPLNPFRPGVGTRPLYLAGRSTEQNEFAKALRQAPLAQNLIITGLRGVGKSVLLDELKPIALQHGWLWTGNDWSETASISEKDVAARLLVDLSTILAPLISIKHEGKRSVGFTSSHKTTSTNRSLGYDDLTNIYERTPGFPSDKLKAVLEQVTDWLAPTHVKGIVFGYDEAQNLSDHKESHQYPLSLVVDVFSSIQRKNKKCQTLLVLTGLPTLLPKLNEARTYTERMFHTMVLDRLSDEEARKAITKPIELTSSSLRFSDKTISHVVSESRGYPFLIQYICKEVFDAWIGKMTVGQAPSVPMDQITAKLDLDFFAPRWSLATDRQQTFMQVIATLDTSDGEFTVSEITAASRELLQKPFGPSHATQMLGHLAEKGLIYRNRRGTYCFAVPLLAGFIRRQAWDASTKRARSQ
jgi:hypothetical protein